MILGLKSLRKKKHKQATISTLPGAAIFHSNFFPIDIPKVLRNLHNI